MPVYPLFSLSTLTSLAESQTKTVTQNLVLLLWPEVSLGVKLGG